jgi:hypothetical protein
MSITPSLPFTSHVFAAKSKQNFISVCQEAVSSRDPEILSLVFKQREFQRATQRLDGIPELLDDLNAVRLSLYDK